MIKDLRSPWSILRESSDREYEMVFGQTVTNAWRNSAIYECCFEVWFLPRSASLYWHHIDNVDTVLKLCQGPNTSASTSELTVLAAIYRNDSSRHSQALSLIIRRGRNELGTEQGKKSVARF